MTLRSAKILSRMALELKDVTPDALREVMDSGIYVLVVSNGELPGGRDCRIPAQRQWAWMILVNELEKRN